MSRKLFLDIVYAVRHSGNYFICKKDCTGMVVFSSLQKCTTALRMLAYGAPGDARDDYIRMAESTAIECMSRFCRAVDEGTTPRVLILAYLVPTKKEARSKDT
jgi:hypothetical protein